MLAMLLLAASTITAPQGKAFLLKMPNEPGIESVKVLWQNKKIPYVRVGDEWIAVVGVDLDVKAGKYPTTVEITRSTGTEKETVDVQVAAVKFPTTQLKVADRYVELNARDLARANSEAKEIETIHNTVSEEILWTQPFQSPVEGITAGSNFGHRRVFNGQGRNPHNGADLRATTGTPIHSSNRGRIVLAKNLFFTGNTVIVDHGLGIYTLYAHLSRIDVKKGDMVDRGQLVGLAGATGRVTGPHLHWGVRVQGARVDPFSLVAIKEF
jgi:murein DD-endopeptidase MepM/ murein hydrolase activator NlpD